MLNRKVQDIIIQMIEDAKNVNIECEVPLAPEKLMQLKGLNAYCVNQVIQEPEVIRDPRKINYYTNQELKLALMAFCLSEALVNADRRNKETREFFAENITVYMKDPHTKKISFGVIENYKVDAAIYNEIIEDWKIYRDREGFGIKALIDNKTNLVGLDTYRAGGDPIYEFARFHRKYTEKEHEKEEKRRESAQEALRNALVQSLAAEVSKQQLLAGQDPLALIDRLLSSAGQYKPQQKTQKIDKQIENDITRLLEYDDRDNSRQR